MPIKIIFSIIAAIITFISYAPYILDVRKGKTKPHVFSWFIWALIAYIAGFAQLKGGGGLGAYVALVSASTCLYIAYLAYKDSSITITRSDWFSLIASLLAIPLWVLTKNPLSAVILVSSIDTIGFWPSLRKAYNAPHEETLSNYWLAVIKNLLAIGALTRYNAITLIYPISLIITDAVFFLILFTRLRILKKAKT
jgi:hypothetical protein